MPHVYECLGCVIVFVLLEVSLSEGNTAQSESWTWSTNLNSECELHNQLLLGPKHGVENMTRLLYWTMSEDEGFRSAKLTAFYDTGLTSAPPPGRFQ